VTDLAPEPNGKQIAITAVGGTQTGVTTHTASSPFVINFVRPKLLASQPTVNPTTGLFRQRPRKNIYKILALKGMTPGANQAVEVGSVRVEISVPAGCESYDSANIRAMLSAAIGYINQLSAGIGDTAVSGIA
jgi:hypothetical protein